MLCQKIPWDIGWFLNGLHESFNHSRELGKKYIILKTRLTESYTLVC